MHLFKFISLTVLLTSSASAITITSGYIVNDVSNVQGSGPFSLTFSDGNTVTGTSYGDPFLHYDPAANPSTWFDTGSYLGYSSGYYERCLLDFEQSCTFQVPINLGLNNHQPVFPRYGPNDPLGNIVLVTNLKQQSTNTDLFTIASPIKTSVLYDFTFMAYGSLADPQAYYSPRDLCKAPYDTIRCSVDLVGSGTGQLTISSGRVTGQNDGYLYISSESLNFTSTPEPTPFVLVGAGIVVVWFKRRALA